MPRFRRQHLWYLLTAIILVIGFVFWQTDLRSDPPMHYTGLGQSLSTDPAQYVFHARNNALFGDSDPYDYPRWTVYRHSLVSLTAYLWFAVAGVSMEQAGMVGVILCLGGLVLLVLGLIRRHSPWVVAALAVCYLLNVTLFTYGRLSYLENGLVFLTALTFLIYSRWGDRLWGIALAGVAVGLATMTGKLFGALLMPALVAAVLLSGQPSRWRFSLTAVAAFVLTVAGCALLFYGTEAGAAMGYVQEQTYGLRGFPEGLSSPWALIERLVSYGFKSHLYYLDTDLLLFLVVGLLLLTVHLERERLAALPRSTMFSLCWLVIAMAGLAPLNYSPLRYAIFIIPAIVIFSLTMLEVSSKRGEVQVSVTGKGNFILLTVISWLVLFHGLGITVFLQTMPRPIRLLTWATLPAAVVLAYAVKQALQRREVRITGRTLAIVGLVLIGCSIIFNGFQIHSKHSLEHNFNIMEANADLAAIVSDGAVVSGPYGPSLTLDTHLKSFIHLFGVVTVDSTLFDRQPITHLAVDASNWVKALEDYPQLADMKPITNYWIRDVEVRIYNISQVFDNEEAHRYKETPFEEAMQFYQQGQFAEALKLVDTFYQLHPQSKSAGLLLGSLLAQTGRSEQAYHVLTTASERFPTDFWVQLQCGRFIQMVAESRKDRYLLQVSERFYARASRLNPFQLDLLRQVWFQVANQYGEDIGTPP